MIPLVVAMPVAAGATVGTGRGDGEQPAMVGLVLASTLLSPLTVPLLITAAGSAVHGGFALAGVVLPTPVGILCRVALPAAWRGRLLGVFVPAALLDGGEPGRRRGPAHLTGQGTGRPGSFHGSSPASAPGRASPRS
ncbi:hypothetical protein ABZ490_16955 [Streptomyces sp. NPDC005811]|uniref:hypothetical protein n=1 Tax=Streptomyces sp. NPDC005811 TaxID=3154565 RepID=UPI0033F94C10